MKSRAKRIFRTLRLGLLLTALAGTALLFTWSRTADPRLHYFLTSTYGHELGRLLRLRGMPAGDAFAEKTPAEFSEAERLTLEALQRLLREEQPTHRLVLTTGKTLTGRVLEETPGAVTFEESYGDSGNLNTRIARSRVSRLEALDVEPPPVSYRDVLFRQAHPALNFYKRPPYTIATDEKFFRVEDAVRVLQELHREFLDTFGPLLARDVSRQDIQVVFFSGEEAFRKLQKRHAPLMASSVGFYSPGMDQFVVFNMRNSEQLRSMGRRVDENAQHYRDRARSYGGARRVEAWRKKTGRQLERMADEQTRETLRHEGAHQLFFSYGVHSGHRIENEWLYEGLAVYCETRRVGWVHPLRAARLKEDLQTGQARSLPELVNHRSAAGFFNLGSEHEVDLAYARSWALVHFLMHEHRAAFFDYICFLRERDHFREVVSEPRYTWLCRHVGLSPAELQSRWEQYVAGL